MTRLKDITCPTCHKKNTWSKDNTFKPFCSERCKLIDLGEWASEKFRIATDDPPPQDTPESDD